MILTFNLALYTIMVINLLALIIIIIVSAKIFSSLINILTPGKEWVELLAIFIGILLIYLINQLADRYSNKIKSVFKKMNQENRNKEEKIKELEKIINNK
jgi:uncharacterized protein YacL